MTPSGAAVLFASLELTVPKAMVLFGRSERTVRYWLAPGGEGPPDHAALALQAMMAGVLARHPSAVRAFIKRCRTRRDGGRYGGKRP